MKEAKIKYAFSSVFIVTMILLIGSVMVGALRYMFVDMVMKTSSDHFSIADGGSIYVVETTGVTASNEDGGFCFINTENSNILCSTPAPRPDNSLAHILETPISPGNYKIQTSGFVSIETDKNVSHTSDRPGAFLAILSIFLLIYVALIDKAVKAQKSLLQ